MDTFTPARSSMQQPARTISLRIIVAIFCLAGGYGLAIKFPPYLKDDSKTKFKSDPTISKLERMNEVVSLKVHISDILECDKNGGTFTYAKGVWIVKGDAIVSVDMDKVRYDLIDSTNRVAEITLPPPHVISERIDHAKTREYDFKTGLFTSSEYGAAAHQEAMQEAQRLILHVAQSSENIELARRRTEYLIHEMFRELDWKIHVNWTDNSTTNAPVIRE